MGSDNDYTFPRPMKKESHHQHLQPRHGHHHPHLDQAKPEDPPLGTPDRAEIAILPGAEVLLHAVDGAQLAGHLEDDLLEGRVLLGRGAGLLWQGRGARLVLNRDLQVDHLVAEGGELVVEAEAVLAGRLGGEDEVALPLLALGQDRLVVRAVHLHVDVEGAAGLDLCGGEVSGRAPGQE